MYNFYNVQTDIANKIINDNAGITDLEFLKKLCTKLYIMTNFYISFL